jgi:hypothetical protein
MDNPPNWREIVTRPLKGWKFFIFLILAFLPWAILRQVSKEEGVILGGLLSTMLLFGFAWLIGIVVELLRHKALVGDLGHLRTNKKALWGIALVVVLVGGWFYYQSAEQKRWECLEDIKYYPQGVYRFSLQSFKTQDEALDYCLTARKHQ